MGKRMVSHRFEYRGWKVTIQLDRVDESVVAGYAELHATDHVPFRIALPSLHPTGTSALTDLGRRARVFIEERTGPSIACIAQARNEGVASRPN